METWEQPASEQTSLLNSLPGAALHIHTQDLISISNIVKLSRGMLHKQ